MGASRRDPVLRLAGCGLPHMQESMTNSNNSAAREAPPALTSMGDWAGAYAVGARALQRLIHKFGSPVAGATCLRAFLAAGP